MLGFLLKWSIFHGSPLSKFFARTCFYENVYILSLLILRRFIFVYFLPETGLYVRYRQHCMIQFIKPRMYNCIFSHTTLCIERSAILMSSETAVPSSGPFYSAFAFTLKIFDAIKCLAFFDIYRIFYITNCQNSIDSKKFICFANGTLAQNHVVD